MKLGDEFIQDGKRYLVVEIKHLPPLRDPGIWIDGPVKSHYVPSNLAPLDRISIECVEIGPVEIPEPSATLCGFPVVVSDKPSSLKDGQVYFGSVDKFVRDRLGELRDE